MDSIDEWEKAITQVYNKMQPDAALALLAFALDNKEIGESYKETHKKMIDNFSTVYEMYINAK